jgi:hypothetical protein
MNGIKCYLSREEARKILSDEILRRLEPQRLLGKAVRSEATMFDDGRVEVVFWTPDDENGQPSADPDKSLKEMKADVPKVAAAR